MSSRPSIPGDPHLPGDDGLLPAERKVQDALGHLPLDFRAMWAISNLFRSSAAIRRHMEAKVLAPDRLSWTSFVGLWVLWVWGEMEAREFAAAVGISRPTATGVMGTLESRGFATRRKDPDDGRMVIVALTPSGPPHDRSAVPEVQRRGIGRGGPPRRPSSRTTSRRCCDRCCARSRPGERPTSV